MSRRRKRQPSPAPGRAGPNVAGDALAPAAGRLALPGRPLVTGALLNLLTVAMLSLAFAPFDAWPLAYVALVPWLLALAGARRPRWALLGATLAGAAFWGANLYWLTWITLPGYFGLAIYLTTYWLVAGAILGPAARRGTPLWLLMPVVWTALEFARTYVISGFPWYFLAHTQYARTALIQIADTTGQYGVSFFVALVNGALADALSAWWRRRGGAVVTRRQWAPGLAAAGVLLAGLLGYGAWRLAQQTTTDGPVIGLVQEALPNRLNGPNLPPEETFALYARDSEALASARCDAVAWSESILRGANPEFLAAADAGPDALRAALTSYFFNQSLTELNDAAVARVWNSLRREKISLLARMGELASKTLGCPIFAGAASFRRDEGEKDWHEFNSVLLVGPGGKVAGEYDKIHPVPFSEYVPFRRSWPWLHGVCQSFVPPVMSSLEPGRDVRWFDLTGRDGRRWRVATPICYEGTFDHVCRRLSVQDGRKRADLLLNLSNDGWFVLPGAGARPSTEHAQHLAHYCFRAVENRLAVLRAANTGISASIDSCGRIEKSMGYEPGTFAAKVLVDARTSVYSIAGDVFAMGVSAVAAGSVILGLWRRRRDRDRVNAT